MQKIVVNAIALDKGNLTPLTYKTRVWTNSGFSVYICCSEYLKKRLVEEYGATQLSFIITNKPYPEKNLLFKPFFDLWRSLLAYFKIRRQLTEGVTLYSISATIENIVLPFLVKTSQKNVIWAVVFDNTVPLIKSGRMVPGNKLVRIGAWVLYIVSLKLLRRADGVFAVREDLAEFLSKKLPKNVEVIATGNGVETDLLKKSKHEDELASDSLFIGRINKAKGIYDLLTVCKIIAKEKHDFILRILGTGSKEEVENFSKSISDYGLQNNVFLHGFVSGEKKFNFLKSTKSFLFLSHTESLPVVLLETSCLKIPAFIYNLDEYKFLPQKYLNTSPMYDFETIARKLLKHLAENDINYYVEVDDEISNKYSWDKIAETEAALMLKIHAKNSKT